MKFKRFIAVMLTFAMCFTALASALPIVSAAEPQEGLAETSVLEKTVKTSDCKIVDGEYNGYIQSNQQSEFLNSEYLKVCYTLSGTAAENANIFTIQPFNTEWGGWQDNFVSLDNSMLNDGVYTAYISMADIKASLAEGSLYGVNISFVEPSDYEATLVGYYYLAFAAVERSAKDWLKYSIDYCENLDNSKYQPQSWEAFTSAIDAAKTVYNKASASDSDYTTARNTLQTAKSKLLFKDSENAANPMNFRVLSPSDTVYEMGVGWNLGNTMDGHTGMHPTETSWQSAVTTKEMIKAIHDSGFNTIRVPVTWGDMIDDDNGYAINEVWMSRVQDIVDYCTELDMYTIINIHHDGVVSSGGWLGVGLDDIDKVYEKYESVWRTIAEKFKNYDEHLIFESANELTCMEDDSLKNSAEAQKIDTPIIMNLNQIFVNVVRSTGSNNSKRWLAAVSHYANRGTSYGFALPTDSYNSENRLMFAQHIYKDTSRNTYQWGVSDSSKSIGNPKLLVDVVKEAHKKFGNDVPIILGEYGTKNTKYSENPSGYNDIGRAYYFECATRAGQVALTVPCVWDQGCAVSDPYEKGTYTIWNRHANEPLFKSITDAMMRGMFLEATSKNKSYDMSDITINPMVTEITKINTDTDSVVLNCGDNVTINTTVEPNNSNDVVLWKSDNDRIATVYRGFIRANSIGTTYVTAFSQSGSVQTRVKVTVLPKQKENKAQSIMTDKESYELLKGKNTTVVASADNGERVMYSCSNEEIASVNREGKIVAKSAGTAYITVTAESGISKTVPIKVSEVAKDSKLDLALNVYYNDSVYAGNEVGKAISVSGDGEYTLSFDINSDLSDKASKAGIKYLKNLVSVYIKDNAVTNGDATKSPLESCEIQYNSIKVNDTYLTITKNDFKSAIKDSGIFDTNDPINGWDGSAVKEVSVSDHVANFTNVDNPTTIEVAFTLKNLKFTEEVPENVIPATSIAADGDKTIKMMPSDTAKIKVKALPKNSTSEITFVSSDKSVVLVDDNATKLDENGECTAEISAVGCGRATVTAISDSGVYETFEIIVNGYSFSNVETVVENGILTSVKAKIDNIPDLDNITVIAVVYTDGILSAAEVKEVSIKDINSDTLTVGGFELKAGNGDNVKVFIWSGINQMIPLLQSEN